MTAKFTNKDINEAIVVAMLEAISNEENIFSTELFNDEETIEIDGTFSIEAHGQWFGDGYNTPRVYEIWVKHLSIESIKIGVYNNKTEKQEADRFEIDEAYILDEVEYQLTA